MISIKRLLEGRDASGPDQNSVEALMRMSCVLLDAMAKHMVRGNETDIRIFRRTLNRLARHMEEPQSTMTVPDIFSGAVEALETYCQRTTEYFLEQNRERHSMVAMLADTVADLSVTRLQAIEKQIEQASELEDIRALRANLANSLLALREAAAQQRNSSVATVERLRGQIAISQAQIPDSPNPAIDNRGDIAH